MKRLVLLFALLFPSLATAQTYTVAPSPFLTAFDNVGKIINNACVWTYLAGTTTAATTYSTSGGTQNTNPIRSDSAGRFTVFLSPGVSYKFVYESPCTPPAHGTTLRTADNISATPASAATVDVQGVAGESVSVGQCVYISDGSGSKSVGLWYKCDTAFDFSSSGAASVGMPVNAIAVGTRGSIRIAGQITGLSSVSPGSTYYVSSSGSISSSPGVLVRQLGIADSATSIILERQPTSIRKDGTVRGPLKGWVESFQIVDPVAGVVTIDYSLGNHVQIHLTQNITTFTITNLPECVTAAECVAPLMVIYSPDGMARTVVSTINGNGVRWIGGIAPTFTATMGAVDRINYSLLGTLIFGDVIAQNQ